MMWHWNRFQRREGHTSRGFLEKTVKGSGENSKCKGPEAQVGLAQKGHDHWSGEKDRRDMLDRG